METRLEVEEGDCCDAASGLSKRSPSSFKSSELASELPSALPSTSFNAAASLANLSAEVFFFFPSSSSTSSSTVGLGLLLLSTASSVSNLSSVSLLLAAGALVVTLSMTTSSFLASPPSKEVVATPLLLAEIVSPFLTLPRLFLRVMPPAAAQCVRDAICTTRAGASSNSSS